MLSDSSLTKDFSCSTILGRLVMFFISWCANGFQLVQLSQFSSETLLLWTHDVVIDAVFSIVLIKYARPSPDGSMCYFELWPREKGSISGSCSHLVCYLHDRAFGWYRWYFLEWFMNTCSVCMPAWCFIFPNAVLPEDPKFMGIHWFLDFLIYLFFSTDTLNIWCSIVHNDIKVFFIMLNDILKWIPNL